MTKPTFAYKPTPAQVGRQYRSPHSREIVNVSRLREILLTHRGAQASIRARDLVALLGLGSHDQYPERSIREAVGILIREGVPIGSTVDATNGGGGYFLIQTEGELRHCVANYVSRARAIERKAEALIDAFKHGPAQAVLISERPPDA